MENKPLFELPKLFALDGKEVTEDQMLTEALLGHECHGGTGNDCNGGSSPVLE